MDECPVCGLPLDGLPQSGRERHVNDCLDYGGEAPALVLGAASAGDQPRERARGGDGQRSSSGPGAPALQVEVDYRGQARGGDGLAVVTWWDAEAAAFCFEIERDDGRGEATESISDGGEHEGAELLTTGRIWPAETGSARL